MTTRIRYKERQKIKSLLKLSIIVILIVVAILAYRTIKADLQASELTLPVAFQSEIQEADTSGEWNLILVNREHKILKNYQVELTQLSNGKEVDSRIYPELQQMFDDARADGLSLFVREGYRTREEQQQMMAVQIEEYESQGYSKKEAKNWQRNTWLSRIQVNINWD